LGLNHAYEGDLQNSGWPISNPHEHPLMSWHNAQCTLVGQSSAPGMGQLTRLIRPNKAPGFKKFFFAAGHKQNPHTHNITMLKSFSYSWA